MSRTEGVHLPRLPTSHARVTSSRAMRTHAAASSSVQAESRRRSLSEPSYTSYVGTPRQDIPHPVFRDAAMYDDVFDKEGRLLSGRNTAKFTSPLHTIGYNSLNDPHCQKLFLNNKRLRSHLTNLGLITGDLRVVASTKEQRQKIRAHELLERREMLEQNLEQREQERLRRLSRPFHVPRSYQDSLSRQEDRRVQWSRVQEMKTEKLIKQQEQETAERMRRMRQKKAEMEMAMNEAELQEQAHRNAIRAQQQIAEIRAYESAYGKTAHWHREADKINNRMVAMKLQWSRKKDRKTLSQPFPSLPPSSTHSHQNSHDETKELKPVAKPQPKKDRREEVVLTPKAAQPETKHGEEREEEGERDREGKREGEREEERDREREGEREGRDDEKENVVEEPKSEEDIHTEEQGEREEVAMKMVNEPVTKESPRSHSQPHTPQEVPVAEQPRLVIAEGDQAKRELTKILIDAFRSVEGGGGSGYVSVDEFLQILLSPDLGLYLEDHEQTYIVTQVDPEGGGVSYTEAANLLPDILLHIFSLRAQQNMQDYGYYVEEEWVQMYPVSGGVVYLNKLTGRLHSERPEEYRPFLKDEVFEDSLVDFFITADIDRDGLIDYEDFYNLLASPQVASRIYRSQMEQLLSLYSSQTADTAAQMNLAAFPAVANPLLLMIYQNAYPDVEEWIELESKKFGMFWLNKSTGGIILQQDGAEVEAVSTSEGGERVGKRRKSKKKRKHRKKSVPDPDTEPHPPEPRLQEPHPQEPRPSTPPESRPSTRRGGPHITSDSAPNSASLDEPSRDDEREAKQDPIKPVSSRSRLLIPAVFETIPEEDETALSDSFATGTGHQGEGEGERDRGRDRERDMKREEEIEREGVGVKDTSSVKQEGTEGERVEGGDNDSSTKGKKREREIERKVDESGTGGQTDGEGEGEGGNSIRQRETEREGEREVERGESVKREGEKVRQEREKNMSKQLTPGTLETQRKEKMLRVNIET